MTIMNTFHALLLVNIIGVAAVTDINTPLESLYQILVTSDNGACLPQATSTFCAQLSETSIKGFKRCESTVSATGCHQLQFLLSFTSYYNDTVVHGRISSEVQASSWASSVGQIQVEDVDECADGRTACSVNAICRNSIGTYRCQCIVGYTQPDSITSEEGTFCVESCDFVTCLNDGICSVAADEASSATCRCLSANRGRYCEAGMDTWKVILISVSAGIAALVGLVLFIYAMSRLLCYKPPQGDDDEVRSELSGYKPRVLGDASRFSDFGSYSRANYSGYQNVGSYHGDRSNFLLRNDGLVLGRKPWDASSDISDPTPTLMPAYEGPFMVRGKATGQLELPSNASGYEIPARHAENAKSVTSDPDYFA